MDGNLVLKIKSQAESEARAAIYARYSSDLQNPRSIEDQEALCRRWCEREGHGVVATFSDAALSGASIHGRAGLKSLISGAVERQFDVVVESFDRVARSQSELPQIWEMLRFCGCELIAVDDGRASEISIEAPMRFDGKILELLHW